VQHIIIYILYIIYVYKYIIYYYIFILRTCLHITKIRVSTMRPRSGTSSEKYIKKGWNNSKRDLFLANIPMQTVAICWLFTFRNTKEWLYPRVALVFQVERRKVKVKCTLLQKLRLWTGRTAHRERTGIALLFHDHGTKKGWGISFTPRLFFTPGKDPVPIVREAGWAPGPVWTSAENLAPTGIRSPDRPARSQSLYRLRYPAYKSYGILPP
jgi:hypothetical protein